MTTNRVGGGPPSPSEPSRSGPADSKKFREEMQKVQKVKEVDPDEPSKKKDKRFAAMMGDEDVAQDLNAGPRKASPFEVSFHAAKPMGLRSSSPPSPRKAIEESASTAVPSPAYSTPPSVDATPRITPDTDTSSLSLPNSQRFWEDVDLPDEAPPPRQNFQETRRSQEQTRTPERPREENRTPAKGAKKKKADVDETQNEKPRSLFESDEEPVGLKTEGPPVKKGKAKEPLEEEVSPFALPGEKMESPFFAGPQPKKGLPLGDDEEEEEMLPYEAPPSGKVEKETLPQKGEFSPFGPPGKKESKEPSPLAIPGKKEEKKPWEPAPTPWEAHPKSAKNEKSSEKKTEEPSPWFSPPKMKEPKPTSSLEKNELPLSPPFTQDSELDAAPHAPKFHEKDEDLEIPLQTPVAPAPFVEKPDRKDFSARKNETDREIVPDALAAPLEKSGEREGGRGGKEHGFQQAASQIIQPSLPQLPANIQPIAQTATVQAAPYLTPETMSLFYQMIGTIYVMTAPTGVSRTEMVLNAPAFANSKFFGSTITIEKYATAPDSLNIRLTGTNEAVQAFNQNITSLIAAFQNGNFKFRIGRIDTAYTVDKPVFKRKERGEGKDSGDFEDRKR